VLCVQISTHEGIGNNQKGIGFIFIFLAEAEFHIAPWDLGMGTSQRIGCGIKKFMSASASFNRPLTISGRNHRALKESELP
jgi:hypothetical protein